MERLLVPLTRWALFEVRSKFLLAESGDDSVSASVLFRNVVKSVESLQVFTANASNRGAESGNIR